MTSPNSAQYYTVKQIAETYHCDEETVRRRIRQGKLHADRFGREYLVSDVDLKAYLTGRRASLPYNFPKNQPSLGAGEEGVSQSATD